MRRTTRSADDRFVLAVQVVSRSTGWTDDEDCWSDSRLVIDLDEPEVHRVSSPEVVETHRGRSGRGSSGGNNRGTALIRGNGANERLAMAGFGKRGRHG